MIEVAALALGDLLTRPFRRVLLKSVALTIALLAAVWLVLQWLVGHWVELQYLWLDAGVSIVAGLALALGLAFLAAPVTALFAGLFLDEVAEVVERVHYAHDPPGRALPFGRSLVTAVQFLAVVLLVNAVALPLVLLVGFGVVIFLLANAYLLGREYFELAALRFHDARTAAALRGRHRARIFAAGLLVAGLLAIPFLNLLGPLFATSLMVHLHKRIEAEERRSGRLLR